MASVVASDELKPDAEGDELFRMELEHVTREFGGGAFSTKPPIVAVDDVSLTIDESDPKITTIAGESGSGKTTLARLLMGTIRPSSGTMYYRGNDFTKLSRGDSWRFRQEVQSIYQDPFGSYNPFYKVDHVLEAPINHFKLASSRAERKRKIEDALAMVGLQPGDTLGRFPHQLSGGQRQRIMVARAMLIRPKLILADEPVSMVDASLRATILDSIRRLNREVGISVVYITHDLTTALQISDNILVMYRGSVVEAGAVERVILEPKHPYTQLLIESIPQPDPENKWGDEPPSPRFEDFGSMMGCKFADRCPHVMDMCGEAQPPRYQVETHRQAQCYLYRDEAAPMAAADLASIFQARRAELNI